jgi:hypothetical protein
MPGLRSEMVAELDRVKVNTRVTVAKTGVGEMLESIHQFVLALVAEARSGAEMAAERKWDVKVLVADAIFGMYVSAKSEFDKWCHTLVRPKSTRSSSEVRPGLPSQ